METRRFDLSELNSLKLDSMHKLQEAIHQNRMLYELWIEPASEYKELRNRLRKRGYINLPIDSSVMFTDLEDPLAEVYIPKKLRKTMLR